MLVAWPVVPNIQLDQKGKYTAQYTDNNGCIATQYFNIDVIATGHYAQIKNMNIKNTDKNVTDCSYTFPLLFRGADAVKDQSYFLSITSVSLVKYEYNLLFYCNFSF